MATGTDGRAAAGAARGGRRRHAAPRSPGIGRASSRLRPGRAGRARSGARRRTRPAPTSASRRTGRSRCCPKAITTAWSGPRRRNARRRCWRCDDAAFLAALARAFRRAHRRLHPRRRSAHAFRWRSSSRAQPSAIALRRARQRRADAAPGRRPGLQRRPARRLRTRARSSSTRRAMRSAIARDARALRRGRRADRWAASRSRTASCSVFGNDVPLARWPRGLALTLLDALPPAEARVHARRCCSACTRFARTPHEKTSHVDPR